MQRCGEALDRVLAVLDGVPDVVEGRVVEPEPPAWCAARGWDAFLLGLSDEALHRAEGLGLHHAIEELPGAPASLRALCDEVRAATRLESAEGAAPVGALRRASPRKRGQVAALAELCAGRVRAARRVVDVGAGHGHLTRVLAEALGVDAVGIDRDADRVRTAIALAADRARFEVRDLGREDLRLGPRDFVVGLHACGALGDAIVREAVASGAAMLLVSCCTQKIGGAAREPLSRRAARGGLVLRREVLGLANLANRFDGVERSLAEIMALRETRRALYLLLRERGVDVAPGEEAHGLNRRRVRHGLRALAPEVLACHGLAPPREDELARVERRARVEHGRIRRLSLPRSMLGRVLELAVVLDRGCAIEERGREARVLEAFDASLSPRNLALLAEA